MDSLHSPRKVVIVVDLICEHSGSFIMARPKSFSEEEIGRFEVLHYFFRHFLKLLLAASWNAKEQSLKGIFGNSRP